MKYEIQLTGTSGKKKRTVELQHKEGHWHIKLDGNVIDADVAEIAPNILSILLRGESYEFYVTANSDGVLKLQAGLHELTAEVVDPRAWSGRRHGHAEAEGRQQIVAPMPGKVVRVLVKTGDKVEAGQGLIVVEAMKMQNEIRSPKTGTVERIVIKEGQPVNAGEILALVD